MKSAPSMANTPGVEPKPKRVKIDIACDTCRTRKVRCDGARPCSNCSKNTKLQHTCHYAQGGESADRRNKSSLAFRDDNSLYPTADLLSTTRVTKQGPDSGAQPFSSSTNTRRESSSSNHGRRQGTSPLVVDSMTAVIDPGSSTSEYFGSSSAGSFTTQIKKAIDIHMGQTASGYNSRRNSPPIELTNRASEQPIINSIHRVLPTRRQADGLLSIYWKYIDPLYPFLDRPQWSHAYRATFDGAPMKVRENVFLATLNIVFALATQLTESSAPQEREYQSKIYCQRAQALLPLNTWDGASIDLIQYFLLVSQYLQSTDHPHQTWMVVGSAVRIAQGLGLHLPETSATETDAVKRDLLRRVWYGCVLMDRVVAVTHGRPASISTITATVVPYPAYVSQAPSKDADTLRTDVSFFVKSVALYEITHRGVKSLYTGTSSQTRNGSAKSSKGFGELEPEGNDILVVLQLDRSLSDWERNIPERLKWNSSEPRGEITHRQAVILRIRLLHTRILVFRPVLGRFVTSQRTNQSSETTSLESRVNEQCARLCVETAKDIIALLMKHQAVDGTVGLLPAWWYRVYYTYTAAIVLIAAKLRPELLPGADLDRAWGQAINVLKRHEKFGHSARRCIAALQILSSKMLETSGTVDDNQVNLSFGAPDLSPMDGSEDFTSTLEAFDQFDPHALDIDFDVSDLAWLNDMQATWEVINQS